ncbi:MAG TPA: IS1595 family transposase [Roseiarcus sp.]
MAFDLSHAIYHDEEAARRYLEETRWPHGPVCPHCGVVDRSRSLGGESMGPGWFYCEACQDKFTVRTGTVYERSHVALHKWLQAFRLLASSKKGISSHQLSRTLGVSYKTAWFISHRIREAMAEYDPAPLGGKDKVVEADETFHGPSDYVFVSGKGWQQKRGTESKRKIMSLVERGGRSISVKVEDLNIKTIKGVLGSNIVLDSTLHTDEAQHYKAPGRSFAKHEAVNHSAGEYARGSVTTNTVEGFFSIFKRGMVGTYQHCGEQHLQRYLFEFDFRYSNRAKLGVDDAMRTERAIKGAVGKRLTYRRLNKRAA